jgi:hypothetical protein
VSQNLWETRELPILRVVADADAAGAEIGSEKVADATGLDADQVGRGLAALIDAGHLAGIDVTTCDDPAPQYLDLRILAKGRAALGTWDRPAPRPTATGSQQILEVLIASPSDTADFRDTIERAIHDWNSEHAIDTGTALLPRRWERDTHPALGASPQQIVNEQIVDRSAILFGVFWTRLGTPTDSADSGTAEEITRFHAAGKPTHVYFSQQPVRLDSVDTAEYERLKEFKSAIEAEGLIGSFANSDDLYARVLRVLTKDVRARSAPADQARATAAEDSAPAVAQMSVKTRKLDSGYEVIVANTGTVAVANTKVALTGGLFMLNAARERIGDGDSMADYDDVGTLSPGSSRRYTVLTAAQTASPRVTVTGDGLDPIEVDI